MSSGFSDTSVAFEFPDMPAPAPDRRTGVLSAARDMGLLGAKDRMIGGRVPTPLLEAAKARSGIDSDSELLQYALSKVALEDDFGPDLLARKGRVAKDVALDV